MKITRVLALSLLALVATALSAGQADAAWLQGVGKKPVPMMSPHMNSVTKQRAQMSDRRAGEPPPRRLALGAGYVRTPHWQRFSAHAKNVRYSAARDRVNRFRR